MPKIPFLRLSLQQTAQTAEGIGSKKKADGGGHSTMANDPDSMGFPSPAEGGAAPDPAGSAPAWDPGHV
jgi:hypothetical protein